MNVERFNELASMYGEDVYGNVFSESGYGISFCFDIATALYVYASLYNSDTVQDIWSTLSTIGFSVGWGFSESQFLEDDTGEYSISKAIYGDIESNNGTYTDFIDCLIWYNDNEGK